MAAPSKQVLILVCFLSFLQHSKCVKLDLNKKNYTVKGILRLPYAELTEDFTAYYRKDMASRIDFYNGLTITIQHRDRNFTYNIMNITNNDFYNKRTCYTTSIAPNFTVQSVFPDLTKFQLVKKSVPVTDLPSGLSCQGDKYQYINQVGSKKNTYTFYYGTSKECVNKPLRYTMFGYDSLMGSHYDKYSIDYIPHSYNTSKEPDSMFDPPKGMIKSCKPMPDETDINIVTNPMTEYVDNAMDHTETAFTHFKTVHKKSYDKNEHEMRKFHFRNNFRFIHSKNRAGLGYSLKMNHMTDWSPKEFRQILGRKVRPGPNNGKPFHLSKYDLKDMPHSLDWRLYGAVTQVKDQAVCGSCWSFGTTGTIEGTYFLKTKNLVRFSQQELIDCSWGFDNNGCMGGEESQAYDWIIKNGGLATEERYGHYLAVNGGCHSKNTTGLVKLTGYVNVTSGDQMSLQVALFNHGPVSVSIDASHKSFSFYANGVYYEPACKNGIDDLDHSVLAVGYGVMSGHTYWLIKNSWSTYWGNDGYVLMAMRDNNCGVETSATFVTV